MSAEESAPPAWREHLPRVAARDLFRAIQADPPLSRTVFLGFRAAAALAHHPVVLGRLVEQLEKRPELHAAFAALPTVVPREKPAPKAPAAPSAPADESAPKEKLKELRARLREKEGELAALEGRMRELQRERDTLQAERDTERQRLQEKEAQWERLQRQQERAARKPSEPKPAVARSTPATVAIPTREILPAHFSQALERLLQRGRHAAVGELCRELLAGELPVASRARVLEIAAAALYQSGALAAAEEQDRLATAAFLDAGEVSAATATFVRLLGQGSAPLRAADLSLLQRLQSVAARFGQGEHLIAELTRLRITSPAGYLRLCQALQKNARHRELLAGLTSTTTRTVLGADELIALPIAQGAAASITARRLVAAVAAGDRALVEGARIGLDTLRRTDPTLVDTLLEAVAQLLPAAVAPLTSPLNRPAVVDASNVARYSADPLAVLVDQKPRVQVRHLIAMRDALLRRGFFPVVLIADANLRHLADNRPLYLSLVEQGQVREVAPGTSADIALIAEARSLGAALITNDRLAEWGENVREIERFSFDLLASGVTLTPR